MNFIDALQSNDTLTENGMVTNSSSLNECVNLFFTIGAMRGQDKDRLISNFSKAFNENPLVALKTLFWVRDVRGGAGERQIFRDILKYLAENHPNVVKNNIQAIPYFGRWDDLSVLFGSTLEAQAVQMYVNGLIVKDGLCAKWIPRKGNIFNAIRKAMNITPKDLRKLLVGYSNTVEQKMCSNEWMNIEYSKVPSLAIARYTKSFAKQDSGRFFEFITKLKNGESKINTGALYPYNVIQTMKEGVWELANEQWKSLPNYMEGVTERILPVVDVSGSMSSIVSGNISSLDVAVSLGLYISERNEGIFKDAFITFSEKPKLEKVDGNLKDRYHQMLKSDWGMTTNLELVFKLILNQATKHNLKPEDMPTKLLIMSDMEFNEASTHDLSAIDMIRLKYEESGYELPKIIFWNIQSRNKNFPVRYDDNNTALISGLSPTIIKSILGDKEMTPISVMNDTINTHRYSVIEI
jgi:hypothetical protein